MRASGNMNTSGRHMYISLTMILVAEASIASVLVSNAPFSQSYTLYTASGIAHLSSKTK